MTEPTPGLLVCVLANGASIPLPVDSEDRPNITEILEDAIDKNVQRRRPLMFKLSTPDKECVTAMVPLHLVVGFYYQSLSDKQDKYMDLQTELAELQKKRLDPDHDEPWKQ